MLQEDVDSFMKQPGNDTADAVLRKLDEQYQKYKYMELNLAQKKQRYSILMTQYLNHWFIFSDFSDVCTVISMPNVSLILQYYWCGQPEVSTNSEVFAYCLIIAYHFCSYKNVYVEFKKYVRKGGMNRNIWILCIYSITAKLELEIINVNQ